MTASSASGVNLSLREFLARTWFGLSVTFRSGASQQARKCCMYFTQNDLERFARWSSDCNPLHVDPVAARQTVFGQNVVHGILSVLRSLAAVPGTRAEGNSGLRLLEVDFLGAVLAGTSVEVTSQERDGGVQASVTAAGTKESLLEMVGEYGARELGGDSSREWALRYHETTPPEAIRRTSPVERRLGDLIAGTELGGVWHAPEPPAEFLSASVGPLAARVLGLCSYLIGMEIPGLRSLFTRLRLEFAPEGPEGADRDSPLIYRLRVNRFERQVRILDLDLEVASRSGRILSRGTLQAYVRFTPARCDLSEMASYLAVQNASLHGQVALVIGGTRGLGAEITAALALAGCAVYASHRQETPESRQFADDLRERQLDVEFVDGDAGDPAWCRDVIRRIREERGRLDLLVLNACAPPGQIQLTSDQTGVIARYVAENLALAMEPLACWQSTLDGADGRIVAISSAAVEMAPRGWSHYVSLKLAVEGLVKGVVRDNSRVSGFVLRPSKLLTAWQDTPTGVLGAIPPSWVAASLLEALAIPTGNERLVVQSNFPQPEISATTLDESGPVDFQLVLAGSFTTDPIVKSLRFWLGELSLNGRVVLAPYGQILQQLLNHASELSTNTRGLGVILLRVQDWLREVPEQQAEDPGELARFLEQTVEAYAQAFQVHRSRCHTPTLLLLCPSAATLPKPQQDAVDRATTDLMRALKSVAGVTTLRSIDF
ncbi:MAG: SDR family NAD(P)-dependent oxidoreductase, partial [Planctomycetaceae bacterium]